MTENPDDFIDRHRKPGPDKPPKSENVYPFPMSYEQTLHEKFADQACKEDPQFTDWLRQMDVVGDITEKNCAEAFVGRFGAWLRYDHLIGIWFIWDGQLWNRDETRLVFHYISEATHGAATKREGGCKTADRASFTRGVEELARSDRRIGVRSDLWDHDPLLLGTPDGTIDLRTGEIRKPRATDFVSRSTAVSPSAIADCPLWFRFLSEATAGDADLQNFLQRFFFYSLTGLTNEHQLVFVYGDGGTGKSTTVNTVTRIMGNYAMTAGMETFTASRQDRHTQELARLFGARLVVASETEEGRRWMEARVKQLTGGDAITANFMRQNSFQFQPTFKLLFSGNHAPHILNLDQAIRRRFSIVPFEQRPAYPDPELEAKLKPEWPGILRWMIDGRLAYYQFRLNRPPAVSEATETYFSTQDTFASWLEEKCIVERGNTDRRASARELFTSWAAYAKSNGESPGTGKSFSTRLQRKAGLTKSGQVKEFKGKGYTGITLRPDDDNPKFSHL